MLTIRVEKFEGPLDLLLELIEAEKLDITDVSLAQVAEQFIVSLQQVGQKNPEELADFLVVAAKLILIKSRVLLPYLEAAEDDDSRDLERQLKMYKVYFDAAKALRKLLRKKRVLYPRQQLPPLPVFTPPTRLEVSMLHETFQTVLNRLEPVIRLPREIIVRTLNLQEKIRAIRERVLAETSLNFSRLLDESRSKVDVIVTFLALLELVKQRTIAVVQDGMFQEIAIVRAEADGESV
ncbi:MAG: segregation/condensation protein A [Candidatus Kerfeldbacteria bacterium]|nr:segregation/condensation protein A [Candidatus Kerfeldbacteria bacterium]